MDANVPNHSAVKRIMELVDKDDMGKQDRKRMIAESMCWRGVNGEVRLLFTPAVLHRNLELFGATFSETTTRRLLNELVEEGNAEKVERGYYRLTEQGAEKYCGNGGNDESDGSHAA